MNPVPKGAPYPFREGWMSRTRQAALTNPYGFGTKEYRYWIDGYDAAGDSLVIDEVKCSTVWWVGKSSNGEMIWSSGDTILNAIKSLGNTIKLLESITKHTKDTLRR